MSGGLGSKTKLELLTHHVREMGTKVFLTHVSKVGRPTGKAGRRLLHKHKTALNDKPNRKCQTDIFYFIWHSFDECLFDIFGKRRYIDKFIENIVKDNIPDIP